MFQVNFIGHSLMATYSVEEVIWEWDDKSEKSIPSSLVVEVCSLNLEDQSFIRRGGCINPYLTLTHMDLG